MTQKGGVELLGQFVPEGTHLSATPWVTHRNRAMYGEDAELFRPERWLEASAEQLQQWKKYDYQFGYGARACPGLNIAQMAIYKLTLLVSPLQFRVMIMREADLNTTDSSLI